MWGKTLAFIIIFILVFGVIVAWIPDVFVSDTEIQEAETLEALTAANLIIYSTTGSDNMTHGYSSFNDGPTAPDWNVSLPEGEYLEVWWGSNVFGDYAIELRHVGTAWWGGPSQIDMCSFYYTDGLIAEGASWAPYKSLQKADLEAAWDSDSNSSVFTGRCEHTSISIVFKPDNGSTDIGEAYDAGYLWYGLSYEWNADDTGFNVMALLINILTFQGIGVGVPGIMGTFIDAVVSTLFYIAIAVVAYVIITAVIPFISGAPDT